MPKRLYENCIVIFDLEEVVLTSFGSPKVKALENSSDNCQEEVLDIQKPKQFDLKDCPYIFMRLTESIRIFNVDLASNS